MDYVLVDELQTRKAGYPVYYKEWTGIGPACTSDFDDAMRYPSVQRARESPAYAFTWTCFEPYEANEDAIWDFFTTP